MSARLVAIIALAAGLPASSSAHELDEYLQAARVSLEQHQILCEIDLTPGADIAPEIVALVDRDENGRVEPSEAEAYGRTVLRDVSLELDGRTVALTLTRVDVPTVGEMKAGVGTIQVRATADIARWDSGRHRLYFRNDHHPDAAVYLVNPLAPSHHDIVLAAQARDRKQREIRLEYDVRESQPPAALTLVFGGGCLIAFVAWRKAPRGFPGPFSRRVRASG
jgi:hypothetical protein